MNKKKTVRLVLMAPVILLLVVFTGLLIYKILTEGIALVIIIIIVLMYIAGLEFYSND